jgi:hypothetical protein
MEGIYKMANPYSIDVADLSKGFQGLMTGFAKRSEFEREKSKKSADLKMREEVLKLSKEGTIEEIQGYIAKNPGAKNVYSEMVGTKNEITKQNKIDSAIRMINGEDPTTVLIESGDVIEKQGGDITQTIEAIKQSVGDPKGMVEKGKRMLAFWAPEKLKALKSLEPEKTTAILEWEFGEKNPGFLISQKNKADSKRTKEISKQNFKDSQSLRKEFLSQSKDYMKVRDSYTRVEGSTRNPSPAGDLSLIFNYMKMLDPGSVVRESEFATAAATGSYGDRIQSSVQKVINGKRLTPKQRKDFVDKAKVLMDGMKRQHKKREGNYRVIAKKNNLSPGEVVTDINIPIEEAEKEITDFQEGQTATGPGGQKMIFKNGVWEAL